MTFVAVNYVYAGDEDGTSASEYFNEAGTFIQGAFASTNEIFRDNHINLQIVPLDTLHIVDPSLAVLDASGLGGNPSIPYLERLTRVDSSNTQAIPVYWPEWINTPGSTDSAGFGPYVQCFSGQYIALDCSWVIVYGASLSNRTADITLAHELGHYFGLPHDNTDPNNLMNMYNPGTNLTQQQRDMVWQTVNTFGERLRLLSETCDLTPQPVVPVTPTLSSTPGWLADRLDDPRQHQLPDHLIPAGRSTKMPVRC